MKSEKQDLHKMISHIPEFNGIGTGLDDGKEVIVVNLTKFTVIHGLPTHIGGIPVIVKVIGEVKAQGLWSKLWSWLKF